MVEKIIVTEEQAGIIGKAFALATICPMKIVNYLYNESDITLVNIARIVDGEEYEIKREFKVGDIIQSIMTGRIYEVTEVLTNGVRSIGKSNEFYFIVNSDCNLICKADNREDLKEASE